MLSYKCPEARRRHRMTEAMALFQTDTDRKPLWYLGLMSPTPTATTKVGPGSGKTIINNHWKRQDHQQQPLEAARPSATTTGSGKTISNNHWKRQDHQQQPLEAARPSATTTGSGKIISNNHWKRQDHQQQPLEQLEQQPLEELTFSIILCISARKVGRSCV